MPEFNLPKIIEPMAIVGIDIRINGIGDLDGLYQVIYAGEPGQNSPVESSAPSLMQGAQGFDQTIQGAFGRAHLPGPVSSSLKPGFLIVQTGDQVKASDWSQIGPLLNFSISQNPIQSMFQQAYEWLSGKDIQIVVMAAETLNGWSVLLLKQAEKAKLDGSTIFALIQSVGMETVCASSGQHQASGAVQNSIQTALKSSGTGKQDISYLETFSSRKDDLDGKEIAGLCQEYRGNELVTAIGRLQNKLDGDKVSGITAIIKTALCLYHRIIPACESSLPPARWAQSQFYIPSESRPWFQPIDHLPRHAAVNILEMTGACTHLIMTDVERATEPANPALHLSKFYLLPVTGNNPEELLQKFSILKSEAEKSLDVAALAEQYYNEYRKQTQATCSAGLVAHHQVELLREVDMALKGIPNAIQKQGDWQTPNGSYFTANPQGRTGKVAFVYPGAFNSYPGMGKDLFNLFPQLYPNMGTITRDIGNKLREKLVYPRSQSPLDDEDLKKIEADLQADAIAMLITGTGMAFLFTSVLRDVFSIQPAAAFGYSLGELSMAFATGVWKSADDCSARLESSPVFVNRLAGPQNAVRETWGMPAQAPDFRSDLWANYVLMSTPEAVIEQVRREEKVYMTHINTPRQVVIGGDPTACQRVIATLHCSALQAPFNYALHCDAMLSEYDGLVYLHSWPVLAIPDVTLYSAANYAPAVITQEGLGNGIAHCLTHQLDFPKLIHQVYSTGVKIFIEVGAGSNCSRWIDESLKDQPHAALSINRRGADDHTSIIRLLARLISHQVKVDLSPLYRQVNLMPAGSAADEDWQSWL